MTQVHDLGVIELATALRAREVSPIEVVDAYLDRIDRWNETVGAYVTVTGDRAHAEAQRAEQAIQRGADDLRPLLGVPIPIKDLTRLPACAARTGRRSMPTRWRTSTTASWNGFGRRGRCSSVRRAPRSSGRRATPSRTSRRHRVPRTT